VKPRNSCPYFQNLIRDAPSKAFRRRAGTAFGGEASQQRRGKADCGQRREATEATEKALNSLDTVRARRKIGSKEAAMPTRRFKRIALAQLLPSGCAVMFGVCVLIEHPQAQPGYVPPPTPLPPPVLNPSRPYTVPQPSYQPITPSTPSTTPSTPSTVPSEPSTVPRGEVTPPAKEEPSSTTARSEETSVAKTRSVHHHHRGRYIGMGPTLGSFYCPYGWCVRISPPSAYYRLDGWYRY
jgi:hypothetical protein